MLQVEERLPASVPWNTRSYCILESDPVRCAGEFVEEQGLLGDERRTDCSVAATSNKSNYWAHTSPGDSDDGHRIRRNPGLADSNCSRVQDRRTSYFRDARGRRRPWGMMANDAADTDGERE